MMVPPKLLPVQVADLRRGATYVAPSGRLCALAPQHRADPQGDAPFAFEYLDGRRNGAFEREGFSLARSNVGLLREVRR